MLHVVVVHLLPWLYCILLYEYAIVYLPWKVGFLVFDDCD